MLGEPDPLSDLGLWLAGMEGAFKRKFQGPVKTASTEEKKARNKRKRDRKASR